MQKGRARRVRAPAPAAAIAKLRRNGATWTHLDDPRRVWPFLLRGFPNPEEALEAAGLSEYGMSQENVEIIQTAYEAFRAGSDSR